MSYPFQLNTSHVDFLFDDNEGFNLFNLVRLLEDDSEWGALSIDVCGLNRNYQSTIIAKFSTFLRVYSYIKSVQNVCASITYSDVEQKFVDQVAASEYVEQEGNCLIFELEKRTDENFSQDPHYVKNVRGAILLSLVEDFISYGRFDDKTSLFDKKSPILLHSSSSFFYNENNAKMMWDILNIINLKERKNNRAEINKRINLSLRGRKELNRMFLSITRKLQDDHKLNYLVSCLKEKMNFSSEIFLDEEKISIWLIDDQQANGWYRLFSYLIPSPYAEIKPFTRKDDVVQLLDFISKKNYSMKPDLALVDLRLTDNDDQVEKYNPQDLSGFEVVKLLLDQWTGLAIMIVSASSRLWNMEKAIEKGAVAYWRKSDEFINIETESPMLTAFDIYSHFLEKFTISLSKVKYKYIFRIMEEIRTLAKVLDSDSDNLRVAIENCYLDIEQKTSWMCWSKTSETRVNDSLCLSVMEIFNELEHVLFDRNTNKLVLFPEHNLNLNNRGSDSQIINHTLDCMDRKYDIGGFGLQSQYESFKGVRNKLPIVHGSCSGKDVKHATVMNVEISLLIIWSLIKELSLNEI
ncbi:hypothetical protein LH716_002021 [Vibrio vulnificus]|uniref:hypothetical protein n=1 Tax=Vibrio vulnificus TaxID=672 RepID=UPI00102D1C68|nr:hypothetical protein [Vibrio vulnificus]EGQ9277504.1 hypothetical protein [Vibrio vulnificus]EIJ0969010.1 hypothetical protein [Vibrio vulnificus]EJV9420853.1 hypothetical protein [Vibrio vulnificus]EJX1092589.1 hypothetical protein [Vibrio vulnificus]EKO5183944.1 hypothetical protein [Vibrio vulnificus]